MITVKGYAATAIEQLPRQFKHPHKLDKKTGTRKLTYSSRIEKKNDAEREEFFTVKEMLCPEKVRLSKDVDGKTNRHQERTLHALQSGRLSNRKTKEKRIFLKYEKLKQDEENVLLCHVYLEKKPFVNAHLIKSGVVEIDCSYDYKQNVTFLNLTKQVNDSEQLDEHLN